MNLRALRTFVATVDAGALGRASERLHLSQPAASRQIGALEAMLGISLFSRVGRGLQLTAEAEALLPQARKLLADADLLVDRARMLKGGETGILRIAATPHVIASVLAPFLPAHARRHPGVEVQMTEGGAAQQPQRLEDGEVHVAIMPAGDERFAGRLLYPVHGLAVMPRSHPLARQPTLEVDALLREPILLLRREFGSRNWFDAACEIAHVKPRVRLESAAPQTLVELAMGGYGIAVVPSTVMVPTAEIHAVPLVQRGAPLGRWSMLAWDRWRPLPRHAERFAASFVPHVRRHPPGRDFLAAAPVMPRPKRPAD